MVGGKYIEVISEVRITSEERLREKLRSEGGKR
jgi:hypothetical protein